MCRDAARGRRGISPLVPGHRWSERRDGSTGPLTYARSVHGDDGVLDGLFRPDSATFLPGGALCVSELSGGRVLVLDGDERRALMGLACPTGLACDAAGTLYVAMGHAAAVHAIPRDGTQPTATGGDAPLRYPRGLALASVAGSADGPRLFVADPPARRIHVLRASGLRYERCIGADALAGPTGVAADEARQRLYAVDAPRSVIGVYSLRGEPVCQIGPQLGVTALDGPTGIALHAGLLLVAEGGGRRLLALTPEGEVVQVTAAQPGGADDPAQGCGGMSSVCAYERRVVAVDFENHCLHFFHFRPPESFIKS